MPSQILTDAELSAVLAMAIEGANLTAIAREVEAAVQLKMRVLEYRCPNCSQMMTPHHGGAA